MVERFYKNSQKQSPRRVLQNVLRNFAKFTGKHLRQSLYFNKVADLSEIVKFMTTTFLTEHLRWLLLNRNNWPQRLFHFLWSYLLMSYRCFALTCQILPKAKIFCFGLVIFNGNIPYAPM